MNDRVLYVQNIQLLRCISTSIGKCLRVSCLWVHPGGSPATVCPVGTNCDLHFGFGGFFAFEWLDSHITSHRIKQRFLSIAQVDHLWIDYELICSWI